jgi:hypothetical protein
MMIYIDNKSITDPASFSVGIMDISTAERNAQGTMMIDRIATKRKLELSWSALTSGQIATILSAVDKIFFLVTYPDPQTGKAETKTFYVGDRTTPVVTYKNGVPLWKELKMNFIER